MKNKKSKRTAEHILINEKSKALKYASTGIFNPDRMKNLEPIESTELTVDTTVLTKTDIVI